VRQRKKDMITCRVCGTYPVVSLTEDLTTKTGLCGPCMDGGPPLPPVVVEGEIAIGEDDAWILPHQDGLLIGIRGEELQLFSDEAQALLRELIKLYPLDALSQVALPDARPDRV